MSTGRGATTPAVTPHPAGRRMLVVFGGLATLFTLFGALMLLGGATSSGIQSFALGLGALATGFWMRGFYQGLRIYTASMQRIARGQLDEAEALLATVPRIANRGLIRRAVRSQRAAIALLRGQVDEAIAQADAAMATWRGLLNRGGALSQEAQVLGTRALAYAAKGDAARVEADAAAAFAIAEATPESLAKAAVARAVILARGGKMDELARYLRENASLLLDRSEPRERVVVRALMRMTRSKTRSVYREPAKPSEEPKANAIRGFVTLLAPEAAGYVDDRPLADTIDAPEIMPASIAQVNAVTRVRSQAGAAKRRSTGKVLALFGVLTAMFLALWQFLTPAAPAPRATPAPVESESPDAGGPTVPDVVAVGGLLAIAALLANNRRHIRRHATAQRTAALGDVEAAKRALWPLANSAQAYIGAWAWYELARLASADAQFVDAAKWCDAGLRRLSSAAARAAASDFVLPGLLTELAVAEAALGNTDDAAAELAILTRDFREYAHLPSAAIRVRLIAAMRTGDLGAAERAARERSADLPLPRREELLADLVLAATSSVSDDERQRLAADLDDPALARWIDAVAPRLRERALAQVRVAPPAAADEHHEEDQDAIAEPAPKRERRT